jgi:hypothetical protein
MVALSLNMISAGPVEMLIGFHCVKFYMLTNSDDIAILLE